MLLLARAGSSILHASVAEPINNGLAGAAIDILIVRFAGRVLVRRPMSLPWLCFGRLGSRGKILL